MPKWCESRSSRRTVCPIGCAAAGGSPLVIHVNGAFHSDFGDGTASRVQRRSPDAKIVVVSAVPIMDLDHIAPKMHRKQGDWVVYTLRP